MLDLAFIRDNPEQIKEACRLKNNSLDVDHLLEVDRQTLTLQRQVEEARAEQISSRSVSRRRARTKNCAINSSWRAKDWPSRSKPGSQN